MRRDAADSLRFIAQRLFRGRALLAHLWLTDVRTRAVTWSTIHIAVQERSNVHLVCGRVDVESAECNRSICRN